MDTRSGVTTFTSKNDYKKQLNAAGKRDSALKKDRHS